MLLIRRSSATSMLFMIMLAAGCTSVSNQAVLQSVDAEVQSRSGYTTLYTDAEASMPAYIEEVLSDTLSIDAAIQLALFNNQHLHAEYASLGISRAAVMQAGRFQNPQLGIHIGYATEGDHDPDLGFSAMMNILDLVHTPMRRAVAASALQEKQQHVARKVLLHAAETRNAYLAYQAALQQDDLMNQVMQAASVAYEAARLLREAGNIRSLDMNTERAFYEQVRLDKVATERIVVERREQLNRLMGLAAAQANSWSIEGRLPDPDPIPGDIEEMTTRASAASLDLAMAALDVERSRQQRRLTRASAWLPAFGLGIGAEREGEWEIGPEIGFAFPLFDQGQAHKEEADAMLRQSRAKHEAMKVDVESITRTVVQELTLAHQAAIHYRDIIVPLQAQLSVETQEQYNAMQIGIFRLLIARRQEVQAGLNYIDALLTYWQTQTTYTLLQQGAIPAISAPSPQMAPASPSTPQPIDAH